MAVFPSMSGPRDSEQQPSQTGSNVTPAKPPRRRIVDQILANRSQVAQRMGMMQMGGPEYMDYLDQMRSNPMNSFF